MNLRAQAALLRAEQVRQVTDRPSKRRSADGGRSSGVGAPLVRMELRAAVADVASSGLIFEGIASVVERGYSMWDMFGEYEEIVSRSAFDASLTRDDLDTPLVLGHDQMRRIARTTNNTLELSMTDEGLKVRAQLDAEDPDVAYISPKLRAGLIDEMSFGFRIDSGTWSPDYEQYRINAADIHRGDVSIVGWGANPYTVGGLRSADDSEVQRRLAKLRAARITDALAS
jgi:HK97 family phage prohead protease